MPPRSSITHLPSDVHDELNERLIAGGFSDYAGLAEWLQSQGFEISKTAIFRHGSRLQASMEKSVQRARERLEIAKALGGMDDADKAALLEASEMVAIDQLMEVLEGLRDWELEDKAAVVPKLIRALSDVGRSAIGSAKWRKDFEAEAEKKAMQKAANEASKAARAEGVSEKGLQRIREALGIV